MLLGSFNYHTHIVHKRVCHENLTYSSTQPIGSRIMKVTIKKEQCAGHARCNAVAGDLFPLDETGYIATSGFEVPPGQEERARRASRACPERVIEVVEDDTAGAATGKLSMRTQP